MIATTLPADLPGLREESERLARETYTALTAGDPTAFQSWDALASQTLWIKGHARLLRDLSRPASRDYWARWLAERVGLTVGATAPRWRRLEVEVDDFTPNARTITLWELSCEAGEMSASVCFGEEARSGEYHRTIAVPGISIVTDPAEALRLAVLAVAGGPS